MNTEQMNAQELELARQHRNEVMRAWWAKQSPEERRERRLRYALNAARRMLAREQSEE